MSDPAAFTPIDPGVFANRLRSLGIGLNRIKVPPKFRGVPRLIGARPGAPEEPVEEEKPLIEKASYEDTALRLRLVYQQIITKFSSLHDFLNIDSSVTTNFDLSDKRKLFKFSDTSDGYPPHLVTIPPDKVTDFDDIFHASYLFYFQLGEMLAGISPSLITGSAAPWSLWGNTLDGLQGINANLVNEKKGIYTEPNIGCREDWYTDEQFAQQHLTGPNPTTIELASPEWIGSFKAAAVIQNNDSFVNLVDTAPGNSIYVQDYSYFRQAAQTNHKAELSSESTFRFGKRYVGASVVLFQLNANGDGKLHPLAIILDYKEDDIEWVDRYYKKTTVNDLSNSVTIFNTRLSSSDPTDNEDKDWPWRYAKMVSQCSDWHRHEVGIHLVHTHLVEEAVIVATERNFENDHIVYQLLNPHWLKTLSLNQAARETLVPSIIANISGLDQIHLGNFLKSAYSTFQWKDLYIPNDLPRRGFPLEELNTDKFRNYPYAKNMVAMWYSIRKFVYAMLDDWYSKNNLTVESDPYIRPWVLEMRDEVAGARLTSFPDINSLDDLTDVITMCIHIASPQHTAVNYLQEYYQVFVPNKPSGLLTPFPTNLGALKRVNENAILSALPLDKGNVWLLSAYIPHLLSMLVAENQNILTYANSVLLYEQSLENEAGIKAAQDFVDDLEGFKEAFQTNSDQMTVNTMPVGIPNYSVMDPRKMAVSILI
ncbi:Lipoxygenase-4 [Dactylella cylindrospora]|nr:Lipoxygenase-4 [Dactylella cylindrospora]